MGALVVSNGYRYAGENLLDLLAHVGFFRAKAEQAASFALADYLAARACELIDLESVGLKRLEPHITNWDSPLEAVQAEAEKSRQYHQRQGTPDLKHDWGCTVSILAITRGPLLILLLAPLQRVYEPVFRLTPGVEPYRYDSRVDGSPEFLPSEWMERGSVWDVALDPSRLITGNPMNVVVAGEAGPMPSRDMIQAARPDFDVRVTTLAMRVSQMRYISENPLVSITAASIQGQHANWEDYLSTREGQEELVNIKRNLAWKIKPTIDLWDILGDTQSSTMRHPLDSGISSVCRTKPSAL
jgi:hypothetical protein